MTDQAAATAQQVAVNTDRIPDDFPVLQEMFDHGNDLPLPEPPDWFDAFPATIGAWEKRTALTNAGGAVVLYKHSEATGFEGRLRIFKYRQAYVLQTQTVGFRLPRRPPQPKWTLLRSEPDATTALETAIDYIHERTDTADEPTAGGAAAGHEPEPIDAAANPNRVAPPDNENVLWPHEDLFSDG